MRALLLVALLTACGGAETRALKLDELDEGARDIVQGCAWRGAPTTVQVHQPEACYNVFTGLHARLADFELADVCDAPALPSPLLVTPGARLWGYFDREQLPAFEPLRFERKECPG